jgi:shikimate dehydrogenase
LGSGGAAEAVVFGLKKLGIRYSIVSRAAKIGVDFTYEDLTKKVMEDHQLIVNTTPVGLYPRQNEAPAIPYEFLDKGHLLYDLIYNPAETIFLKNGKEKGAGIKNGEEMLKLQAEESWRIWNQV